MIQSLPKNRFSKGKKSILDAIWTIENIKNHQTENPLRNLHMVLPVTIACFMNLSRMWPATLGLYIVKKMYFITCYSFLKFSSFL